MTKPGPGSGSAQWTGQVKEVTKGFVQAMKTHRVDYDEEVFREKPGVIILNPRKYRPDESTETGGGSATAQTSIARPL